MTDKSKGRIVTPAASFQPPDTCSDCADGVPFGANGHHVNRVETLKEHALRLIAEIQECPENMGAHCIQVLCDELEPLIRAADISAPTSPSIEAPRLCDVCIAAGRAYCPPEHSGIFPEPEDK